MIEPPEEKSETESCVDSRRSDPSITTRRSKEIDILRALAIFLVFGRHMYPVPPEGSSLLRNLALNFMTTWNRGGWVGVDLFFVLSGFLVSGLLFREHQKFGVLSAKDFLIRRGFKIYPAFWMLIGVTASAEWFLRHRFNPKALLSELLFIQNYGPFKWVHTWSLAVEEHFYVLLLLFLILLSRRAGPNPFRRVPFAFVVVAILSLALRLATAHWAPYTSKTHLFPSHLRMDSLFLGVVISYYFHYHSSRFLELARYYRVPAAIVGTLALVPAFIFPLETFPFTSTFGVMLFYLGSGLILTSVLTMDFGRNWIVKSVAYIGSHSYSIYLWHIPVIVWLLPVAKRLLGEYWSWSLYFTLYIIGALSVGIIMALLVEFPVLRIRDRWFPSRAKPLSQSDDRPDNAPQRTGSAVIRRDYAANRAGSADP